MKVWFKKMGRGLIAMLVVTQLCVAVHAAEYGTGPHTHGETVCHYGLGNDGDPVIGSAAQPFLSFKGQPQAPILVLNESCDARGLSLPPATGPPVHD